jgi:hypothetical protein
MAGNLAPPDSEVGASPPQEKRPPTRADGDTPTEPKSAPSVGDGSHMIGGQQ